jgi:hypothetical protein
MLQSFPPYAMHFEDSGYFPPKAAREKLALPKKSAREEEEYVFV